MEKRLINYEDLSKSEKIDHIWEYYKFHIIATCVGILFVFGLLNHYIFNPPAEITLDVSVFGIYAEPTVMEELELALNDIIVQEDENEESTVDFFSISDDQDYNTQQAMVTKMIGKATLHDFDIMIFEGEFYQNYLQEDTLLSLNDMYEAGLIDVDEDMLRKGSEFDYPSDDYYLIDITGHEGFARMLNPQGDLYLGIFSVTNHSEHIEESINYILNEFK